MIKLRTIMLILICSFLFINSGCKPNKNSKEQNNIKKNTSGIKGHIYLIEANAADSIKFKYPPSNLIDGTNQSWCIFNNKGSIFLGLKKHNNIEEIYIKNGYGNQEHYSSNNRVKDISIIEKIKNKKLFSILLKDTPDFQKVKFPKPVNSNIEIKIDSVYKGSKYNDTCIAEIAFEPFQIKDKRQLIEIESKYKVNDMFYLYPNGSLVAIEKQSELGPGEYADFIKGHWFINNQGGLTLGYVQKTYSGDPNNYSLINKCEIMHKSHLKKDAPKAFSQTLKY